MKTILVPTDFSESANNALRYAVELAGTLLQPIELVLLNVFETPEPELEHEENRMQQLLLQEQAVVEKLQAYARQYCRHNGIRSTRVMATSGSLGRAIAGAARQCQADMVVMGTRGATGAKAFFNGSNTSEFIGRTTVPVLVVPEGQSFRSILKIVFAADLSATDLFDLKKVANLALALNTQVQVVHVSGIGEESNDAPLIMEFWSKVQSNIDYPWLNFVNVEADEIGEGLAAFVDEQRADLLVVCPKKRSVFYRLVNGSTTRQMVLDARIPMLALPHSEHDLLLAAGPDEYSLFPREIVDYVL